MLTWKRYFPICLVVKKIPIYENYSQATVTDVANPNVRSNPRTKKKEVTFN